ncbi:hypothetical protein GCM10029964_001650 [Kibdelosporangium lantanae]
MSRLITEISSREYRKSPGRGRIRACTSVSPERIAASSTSAWLGVRPPSDNAEHSSTRSAPALAAIRTPLTDSTLISTRIPASIQ